ncbi:3-isopropylmalate dehydratase small subunit 1-like [Magnolia sinica]|uniref:3-isopropylmalate dehydratase small subunit 1-like n=1 Tax=Magnolia sinica TaxID=86752 RepID=UPI002659866C|nr:3-isopropylmalate dehydratase small subunit 1-like [Magnolia sinica]
MAMAMAAAATATAATAKIATRAQKSTFLSSQKHPLSPLSPNPTTFPKSLKLPTSSFPLSLKHSSSSIRLIPLAATSPTPTTNTFHGLCYVVRDNIDTDQIIPAEHLTLVPSKPDEYSKLGSFALVGLPSAYYPIPFIEPGQSQTRYSILIGGYNFGCGSSREHAPVALGASGVRAVVAESYARIFFRNCVATGEVYPLELESRLCDECTTGDVVTIELEECRLINHTTGKEHRLKPIGDAGPVIEAGGIFAYARKTGMIASK